MGEVEGLIEEIGAFPEKIQEAADGAKGDIEGMEDFGAKMKAGSAVAGAIKDCKKCVTVLLSDLKSIKGEVTELKDCGE